jgi:AcrR family transcriptional regulator
MDKKSSQQHETRIRLLVAACQIALEHGITQVTLDAVAKAAGVSKGGLFYHFAGKEALYEAMVTYLLEAFDTDIEAQLATTEHTPSAGQWLRAYVRAHTEKSADELQLSIGLLAAVALNPDLLKGWRDRYDEWQAKITASTSDPVLATIIRYATDGMWFAELLGVAPPSDELRGQILERLIHMTE